MNREVANYLKSQAPLQRKVLDHMHEVVIATIPNTDSKISYGIIGFTYKGKVPFYISGWKNHVSIHGGRQLGKKASETMPELKVVGTTIQIDPEKPLSDAKLRKLIKLRLSIFDASGGRQ